MVTIYIFIIINGYDKISNLCIVCNILLDIHNILPQILQYLALHSLYLVIIRCVSLNVRYIFTYHTQYVGQNLQSPVQYNQLSIYFKKQKSL